MTKLIKLIHPSPTSPLVAPIAPRQLLPRPTVTPQRPPPRPPVRPAIPRGMRGGRGR